MDSLEAEDLSLSGLGLVDGLGDGGDRRAARHGDLVAFGRPIAERGVSGAPASVATMTTSRKPESRIARSLAAMMALKLAAAPTKGEQRMRGSARGP